MKKRDIIAATVIYALIAFMIVAIVGMMAGDCPTALTKDVYQLCEARANGRLLYGSIASIILYPLFLWFCVRRAKRGST